MIEIDAVYVREVAEEIRSRLFPRPTVDGRQPYPLPVAVWYEPGEFGGFEILFVPERTIQHVEQDPPTVPPTTVRVIIDDGVAHPTILTVDLEFGRLPDVPDEAGDAITELLQVIAGR